MDVIVRTHGVAAVVRVTGEVDVSTSPRLRSRVSEIVSAGHVHLLLDLTGVEFLESTGLAVLVGALNQVRADHGSIRLAFDQRRLTSLFAVTRLDRVFSIFPTVAQAVEEGGEAREALRAALASEPV